MVDAMYIYGYVNNELLIPGLKEVDVYAVTQAAMATGTIAHSSDLRKYRPPGSMEAVPPFAASNGKVTLRFRPEPNFTSSKYPQNFKNGSWI
jgi:hypothetical protein